MSLLERYTQPAEAQIPTVSHQGEIPSGMPTTTIWIDGQEVTAVPGAAILRAAQRAGFNIPTLCDDEKLAPAAACRMCLVNIEGQDRPMPSCHLAVEPGMKITATDDGLFKLRKQNLEYILSDHNAYCMPPCQVGCPTHIDIPGYLELMTKGQHVEAVPAEDRDRKARRGDRRRTGGHDGGVLHRAQRSCGDGVRHDGEAGRNA